MANTTEFKIDTETVTLVRVNQRKWILQDSEGTIIHTGNTKKGALIYIDSLVSAAKSLAARKAKTESESKLVGTKATPVKPSKKPAANGVKSAKVASKPAAKVAKSTKTAKSKPAAKASKPKAATVKTDKNVNHFKFGKSINADIIMGYGEKVWGGVITLSNVKFVKSHYWMGTATNDEGVSVDNIRMDYLCSYCRVPTVLKSDDVIAQQEKAIAAATATE